MSITVTVTPPSVVPAITGGATVQVAAGAAGVGKTSVGAALRLSVANIDDPSTELAALGDSTWPAGTIAICTQDVAGANAYRVYVLDLASSTAQSTPNRIDRAAGGQWILEGGKGVAGSFTVETTLAVGGAATIGGTLGVTGAATFSSTLSAGASTLASATITGAATVGTTLGVTGATTLSSTLGVAGAATFTAGTASSSSSTGTVVVSGTGGVGVGGAINAGGAIGSASTITGTQLVSTVSTGTAPLSVASTTVVPNLNVSQLLGATWASPAGIGTTTPASGAFTTVSATGAFTSTATGAAFSSTGNTTSQRYLHINNTSADFYVGVESSVAGAFFTGSAAYDSVVYSSGHLYIAGFGGVKIGGGAVTVSDTTVSSSTTTGSGVFGGGVGIAGAANIGGSVTANTTILAGSDITTNGKVVVDDATGGGGNARELRFTNTGASTKTNWRLGAQVTINNGFEIGHSTAAGGSTYTTDFVIATGGDVLIGTSSDYGTPAYISKQFTLSGNTNRQDGLAIQPSYTGAFTVARCDYLSFLNPALAASAAVTDAFAIFFDAAVGTHKALDAATTKTTPSTVNGWLKLDVNGTTYFVPMYTSKTT